MSFAEAGRRIDRVGQNALVECFKNRITLKEKFNDSMTVSNKSEKKQTREKKQHTVSAGAYFAHYDGGEFVALFLLTRLGAFERFIFRSNKCS